MELAGIHEAAEIAGISRQRFHLLMQLGRVPPVYRRLHCGPIWDAAVIEEWAKTRNRVGGRKRNMVTVAQMAERPVVVRAVGGFESPRSHHKITLIPVVTCDYKPD